MSWRSKADPGRGVAPVVRAALAVALAVGGAAAAASAAAETKPAGTTQGARPAGTDVLARVNGNPILRRDFDLMVQVQFRQRGPGQRRHEDLEAVRKAALDALIDGELLYQKAAQAKVAVSDADVREEAKRLRDMLGTPEEVAAFLQEAGMRDRDLDTQVRRSLTVKRYVESVVTKGVEASEAQARAWYDAHPEAMARPESVRISQIVVQVPAGADASARAEARRKIEAILKEIKSGKDFSEMARLHSDGPEARRGGDVGFVWPGGGALPPVERAALGLQPGQMSDIVESRRGFHLIKAMERRPAGAVPFSEARPTIAARLVDEQRDERVRVFVAELRRGARIEKVS